jgi:hypothetical protein
MLFPYSKSTQSVLPPYCCWLFLPSAGHLDDLYSFNSVTMTWTLLSAADSNDHQLAREGHGLMPAEGKLFVYGGVGNKGDVCALSSGLVSR